MTMKKKTEENSKNDKFKLLRIAVFFIVIIFTSVITTTLGLLALIKFVFLG